jgi:hypothetical protein
MRQVYVICLPRLGFVTVYFAEATIESKERYGSKQMCSNLNIKMRKDIELNPNK